MPVWASLRFWPQNRTRQSESPSPRLRRAEPFSCAAVLPVRYAKGASMRSLDEEAVTLMAEFADGTGLASNRPPRRYLWTDAFAVFNFIALMRMAGNGCYRDLTHALIEQVHHVLGRYRPDDARTGWLSGLSEQDGAQHPTRGGLRIGKSLPERRPEEPIDRRLEWERDGQYFHYLTKWMDALVRAAVFLNEPRFRRQALELAQSVFPRFLQIAPSGEPIGLAWKMSVDLSRPLVTGINPHDALDGYITFRQIGLTAGAETLDREIEILRELASAHRWGTDDPLGLGGLLMDAFRLAVLPDRTAADEQIIADVLAGASAGLRQYLRCDPFAAPASQRLAFRELGLAIGIQTLPVLAATGRNAPSLVKAVGPHLTSLQTLAHHEQQLVAYWSERSRRSGSLWQEHRDINDVMLATALLRAYVGTLDAEAVAAANERRRDVH